MSEHIGWPLTLILVGERNDRAGGTVRIWRRGPRRFVVERSDSRGVFDRIEGFRTLDQARREFRCYT